MKKPPHRRRHRTGIAASVAFSSNFFLFAFMPLALALHGVAPRHSRNAVLVVINLLFYAFDSGWLAWILVFSILLNHVAAKALANSEGGTRKAVLVAAIAANLALLFHYKYTSFLWDATGHVLRAAGIEIGHGPAIELPIGISFFTFQALSYLADVNAKRCRPAARLVDFAMYHSLFPQLIAGPIVRYVEIEGAIYDRRLTWDAAADGVFRFCLGLGKKIIIADNMGVLADPIFALPASELTTPIAWLGVLAYTLQIYFDFSGYSDMAIGLARLLGFAFPENFNLPYRSRSITEFWRRWHMTLSRWFRDYVYIPLGGNRNGPWRTYRNLFVVFLLCGLWHGAGYTFVLWGLYHGVLLALERAWRDHVGPLPEGPLAWATTFLLLMLGWVLFRSPDIATAGQFFKALAGFSDATVVYYPFFYFFNLQKATFLLCGLVLALAPLERFAPRMEGGAVGLAARSLASLAVFLYSALLLAANSFNPFIYFRF
jgi:alginate O-acetyltransferase complex protein AlgI